jgi:GxxExxY protein
MMILHDSRVPAGTEDVAHRVIGCAIQVHRVLGPGFKESIYVEALCLEMDTAGLSFEREKSVVVPYRGWEIPGQRVDLIVAEKVIIELKAIRKLKELHRRQLVSYLKACNLRLGLLLNFNVSVLRNGIKRVVL